MKKLLALVVVGVAVLLTPIQTGAGTPFVEPVKMRVTCYLPTGNPTASGVMPYVGSCAAKREWLGGAVALYTLDGEFVTYLSIEDTGGHPRIKSGQSIDVFTPDMQTAREWVATYGDYMLVQVFPDAQG